jgi:hypothetical protein
MNARRFQQPTTAPPQFRVSNSSGKLVIIGIVAIALIAAGTSWWFRLHATHRAARFWGPDDARLLRDAPVVLLHVNTREPAERDISSARGLVHLRSALLEDRSFSWPATPVQNEIKWEHGVTFQNDASGLPIFFSSDFHWLTVLDSEKMLSCQPIAVGLREMFTELESQQPAAR